MRRRPEPVRGSLLTRAVNLVFSFVRLAEFEILFVLFFVVAFIIFKDLVERSGLPNTFRELDPSLDNLSPTISHFRLHLPHHPNYCLAILLSIRWMTSRPEYNEIFVKKPEGEFWSF